MSLKGYGCICYDFSLHLLSFWNGVYNDFKNRVLIFKNSKFSNWHKKISLPQNSNFSELILSLMHPTLTCKPKYSEKIFFKTVLSQKLWFCYFYPKYFRMDGKSIQVAAKAILVNMQKNLMIFDFTIFPLNLKKKSIMVFEITWDITTLYVSKALKNPWNCQVFFFMNLSRHYSLVKSAGTVFMKFSQHFIFSRSQLEISLQKVTV